MKIASVIKLFLFHSLAYIDIGWQSVLEIRHIKAATKQCVAIYATIDILCIGYHDLAGKIAPRHVKKCDSNQRIFRTSLVRYSFGLYIVINLYMSIT